MEANTETDVLHWSPTGLKRVIGKLGGNQKGPVLIFVGGIHGNEPSGVIALQEIFSQYAGTDKDFRGKAYALCGNIKALETGNRYLENDLNRMWCDEFLKRFIDEDWNLETDHPDELELIALMREIQTILDKEEGPFMFFDLHTTSAPSSPFVLINDTVDNRALAERYPLRIILGIEEYLTGPMLSYINDQGYVSLGFEAGQHHDPNSIAIHKAFVLQSFMLTGFMKDEELYHELIRSRKDLPFAHAFFEVRHCYRIGEDEKFRMLEGYTNFSSIRFNQLMAKNENGEIRSIEAGYVFMPLYQTKGSEGFFIIKLIPTFWLRFSSFLRKINFEYILLALPGVERHHSGFKTISVNIKIARYLSRELFHLLGYRRVHREGFNLVYVKRELTKSKY